MTLTNEQNIEVDVAQLVNLPRVDRDRAIVKFLCSNPWAIMPTALETIVNVVADHIEGKAVVMDASASQTKIVSHADYPQVAVVNVIGTIAKRLYGLEAISGGNTTIDIRNEIQAALDNPNISAIVLNVDSPGGTVDGTKELADFIATAKEQKPIVAYADGLMASAAYWIGSAASKIVAFDTSQVGSIGVIVTHYDQSVRLEQQGIKATHIYAGKYKAYGNGTEPLAAEAKSYIQERVDTYYSLFVDSVAAQRGVDAEVVVQHMAEGKIFIGRQAKIAGLVDEIGNIETAIRLALEELEGGTEAMATKDELKEMSRDEAIAAFVEAHGPISLDEAAAMNTEDAPAVVEVSPEVQAQLDEMQSRLDIAEQTAADTAATLATNEANTAADALNARIVGLLTPYKLEGNEALVALGTEVTEEQFAVVLGVVDTLHNKSSVLVDELAVTTEGATEQASNKETITSQDDAVSFIQNRDGIEDVEEAIEKAAVEFPALFAK